MENLSAALTLLAVGMGTVFVILFFIIYFSKGLILLINKYVPEEMRQSVSRGTKVITDIPSSTIAAITAAVNVASIGRASVVKIEKENKN